ncbi:outer membrane protein OmpK [Kistimonas scapharcae]
MCKVDGLRAFRRLAGFCLLIGMACSVQAEDYSEDTRKYDHLWMNWHLYRGIDQRGGPYKFDDTYFEIEFGGRSGIVAIYGYVDILDILGSSHSDKNKQDNFFAKVSPRISLDGLFGKDLAIGPIVEWYLSFTLNAMDGDKYELDENDKVIDKNGGGQNLWVGFGADVMVPWLGKTGVDFYKRYVYDNYGASNERSWDGYVLHANWFKPLKMLDGDRMIAFQGYFDWEFDSKIPKNENAFEKAYRTDDSFQAYLGLWYHDKHWGAGYGAKLYHHMTQWKNGEVLNGKKTDSNGVGHYFNVFYRF